MVKWSLALFLFSTLTFHSAHSQEKSGYQDKMLRYFAKNSFFRGAALHDLLQLRCERYANHFMDRALCTFSLTDLVLILDFDIVFEPAPDSYVNIENEKYTKNFGASAKSVPQLKSSSIPKYVFVAFKTTLLQILEQKSTGDYLKLLNNKFYRLSQNLEQEFDLWAATVAHFKGDEFKAAQHIAVLLQDMSPLKLHVEYVQTIVQNRSEQMEKNLMQLSGLIDNMNFFAEVNPTKFTQSLYPKVESKNRNHSAYHFYVPLYLSKRLQLRGYTKRLSAVSAFMLPLTYELITAAEGLSNILFDPKKIESDWKIQDIMQGYSGALFGLKMKNLYYDQSKIKAKFNYSTYVGARTLTNL